MLYHCCVILALGHSPDVSHEQIRQLCLYSDLLALTPELVNNASCPFLFGPSSFTVPPITVYIYTQDYPALPAVQQPSRPVPRVPSRECGLTHGDVRDGIYEWGRITVHNTPNTMNA